MICDSRFLKVFLNGLFIISIIVKHSWSAFYFITVPLVFICGKFVNVENISNPNGVIVFAITEVFCRFLCKTPSLKQFLIFTPSIPTMPIQMIGFSCSRSSRIQYETFQLRFTRLDWSLRWWIGSNQLAFWMWFRHNSPRQWECCPHPTTIFHLELNLGMSYFHSSISSNIRQLH